MPALLPVVVRGPVEPRYSMTLFLLNRIKVHQGRAGSRWWPQPLLEASLPISGAGHSVIYFYVLYSHVGTVLTASHHY